DRTPQPSFLIERPINFDNCLDGDGSAIALRPAPECRSEPAIKIERVRQKARSDNRVRQPQFGYFAVAPAVTLFDVLLLRRQHHRRPAMPGQVARDLGTRKRAHLQTWRELISYKKQAIVRPLRRRDGGRPDR